MFECRCANFRNVCIECEFALTADFRYEVRLVRAHGAI